MASAPSPSTNTQGTIDLGPGQAQDYDPNRKGGQHTRLYQACIPCRQRKVKCDMGPVDDPHDPPCMRCKRERLECYFSTQRRKRYDKGDGEQKDDPLDQQKGIKRYPIRRDSHLTIDSDATTSTLPPLTPGGSIGRPKPLRRPDHQGTAVSDDDEDQSVNDGATAILQNREMLSGHDALNTAFAATGVKGSTKTAKMNAKELNEAVKAWADIRFVRAGWFTALEGISYIEYFYRYLSPLTPITVADYRAPKTHQKLLREEPVLAIALLTISSRYMALSGPGAQSRAYAIHDKLWGYLRGLVDDIYWGQEQSAGVTCDHVKNNTSRSPFRTLGTIETLLLLTEWHPRALHFSAGQVSDDLLVLQEIAPPSEPNQDDLSTANVLDSNLPPGSSGKKVESWLEPCWRSDRMCWSLVSHAMTLAYELGVMDDGASKIHLVHANAADSPFDQRRYNIRRLLYVYLTQTSGRLSLPSPIPKKFGKALFEYGQQYSTSSASSPQENGEDPLNQEPSHDMAQDKGLDLWFRLARLFAKGNAEIFPSRNVTHEIIRSGRYREILDSYELLHFEWRKDFDECEMIPKHMRYILEIEYEYMRVYGNCLALQAVVDRCVNQGFSQEHSGAIHPRVLAKWVEQDRKYIQEIVVSSQNLLRIVVEGLWPGEYLKHAPVRTYFRIVCVSMVLIKTFALGANEGDAAASLGLLDRAVHALRTCVVDDIHAGSQFADFLSILIRRVRGRMIRVAAKVGSSTGGGGGHKRRSASDSTAGSVPSDQSIGPPRASRKRRRNVPEGGPQRNMGGTIGAYGSPANCANMVPVGSERHTQQLPLQAYTSASSASTIRPQSVHFSPGGSNNDSDSVELLKGIPTPTFNANNPDFSIMPPPSFNGWYDATTAPSAHNTLFQTASTAGPSSSLSSAATSYAHNHNHTHNHNHFPNMHSFGGQDSSLAFQQQHQQQHHHHHQQQPANPFGFNSYRRSNGEHQPDWIALPLDPMIPGQSGDVEVGQTGHGPEVGGSDMLDVLLAGGENKYEAGFGGMSE